MKLLEPIKVGNIEFKNRIMFPPLTTGYEEKDEMCIRDRCRQRRNYCAESKSR